MIPFGFIGAVLGHYVLGLTMSILSLFAIIALAGIVVNNSIILVATIERRLKENAHNEEDSIVKEKVQEWYKDSSVNVKRVKKIKVNKMNKLIRTETYDNS